MLGFGNGLERGVRRNMFGFATNSVFVGGDQTSKGYRGMQPGRAIDFRVDDIAAIRQQVPEVDLLAPRNQLGGWRSSFNVTRGTRSGGFTVSGDYPEIQAIMTFSLREGRFINHLDIADQRKVAVIGTRVREQLFASGEQPIGQHVEIQGVYFTVVGLFSPRGSSEMADRDAGTIFVPFTTFGKAFNRPFIDWIALTAKPGYPAAAVEEKVLALLRERHRVHPDDENAIWHFNAEKEFDKVMVLFTAIRVLVWIVGVVTLLAGVIGVSNIMLIVIRERTREIGLRKAVGATPLAITFQIIQETTALTAAAGYFGLVAGVGLLELVAPLFGAPGSMMAPPAVDLEVALVATAVLVVSGALAGFIPARAAVRVNPIEALRAG
jgi:putative ABC transport system permease protein